MDFAKIFRWMKEASDDKILRWMNFRAIISNIRGTTSHGHHEESRTILLSPKWGLFHYRLRHKEPRSLSSASSPSQTKGFLFWNVLQWEKEPYLTKPVLHLCKCWSQILIFVLLSSQPLSPSASCLVWFFSVCAIVCSLYEDVLMHLCGAGRMGGELSGT